MKPNWQVAAQWEGRKWEMLVSPSVIWRASGLERGEMSVLISLLTLAFSPCCIFSCFGQSDFKELHSDFCQFPQGPPSWANISHHLKVERFSTSNQNFYSLLFPLWAANIIISGGLWLGILILSNLGNHWDDSANLEFRRLSLRVF